LKLKVIEPSSSPYSAPIVIDRKKDGTNRYCIDFCKLNNVKVFNTEPMLNPNSIFSMITGKHYISVKDIGRYQWAMTENQFTAFSTPCGLNPFRTMPFGLVNYPATFCRLMRKLLHGINNVDNFIDDIILAIDTWEKHLQVLTEVITRLRNAGLTARPSKCFIGYDQLNCLGHVIGGQRLHPELSKIKAFKNAPTPTTKTQIQSFIGLVGFYRQYIPNFSATASTLSHLTKKGEQTK
jgi:hypothetical protein